MTTSMPERIIPGWLRSISLRRTGVMILMLALLFICTSYLLLSQLNYPEILIEKTSFVTSLVAQGKIAGLVGFVGLLLCGLFLVVISLSLADNLQGRAFKCIVVGGSAAGVCWIVGAILGLGLVPLWGSGNTGTA